MPKGLASSNPIALFPAPVKQRRAAEPKSYRFAQLKAVMDRSLAILLILLMSPLFVLVSLLIMLDSRGTPMFRQWRRGLHQEPFRIYKFRTMRKQAHDEREALYALNDVDGIIFKLKQDPRITTVGRFLRKYSIDELPQLINVALGEMSLVGPRPFPLEDFERPAPPNPFYASWLVERHRVLPGISGLWQVSGRNNLPFDKLVRLDLLYVRYWSVGLDAWILWKTITVVLSHKGAY